MCVLACLCVCTRSWILYSGKLSREKQIGDFRGEHSRIAHFCSAKGRHTPNFEEKTFVYSHKITKFAKVFSLKSFPLYGSVIPKLCLLGG